jgi:hypothetical protein
MLLSLLLTPWFISGYMTPNMWISASKTNLKIKGGQQCATKSMFEKRIPKYDLWIVGAGTLGTLVAQDWIHKFPGAKVVAETRTTSNHKDLKDFGAIPRIRSERYRSTLKITK